MNHGITTRCVSACCGYIVFVKMRSSSKLGSLWFDIVAAWWWSKSLFEWWWWWWWWCEDMKEELVGTASRALWWFEASFVWWWWWGEDTKGELADKASLAQWLSGDMVGVVVGSPWGFLSA